jgi:class 3 adenylate cyclase
MGEGGSPGGRGSRLWRTIWQDHPAALALLLGEERSRVVVVRSAALWGLVITTASIVVLLLPRDGLEGVRPVPALAVAVGGFLLSASLIRSRNGLREAGIIAVLVPCFVAMSVMVWALGPGLEVGMVAVVGSQSLLFLFVRRRLALLANAVAVAGYAAMVLLAEGYPAPHVHLVIFTVTLLTSTAVASWAIGHIERLAIQERRAQEELSRAHAELADLNRQLEVQLDQQGLEIGSLRRLQRFLSPQVAEAVLQDGIGALVPHRCRIAVVFCDLRGFTAFSSSAEPEEVMEVLDRYYVTVGRALHRASATVGTFAGDGIMAYFGDPLPHEDPAGTAVRMAVDMREPMAEVVTSWRRRGFDLGCGVGIAYGYATIGPVGFEERTDYTALGPTVNLASRLCNVASDGEVLIDVRAHEAVEDRVRAEERTLDLRGFRRPVVAHAVLEWCGEGDATTATHR